MIKPRSKPSRVAQQVDHGFLPLVPDAFSLLFQFCQLGCHHTRTSQQIEGCTLRVMDLPGDPGREPQTGLGVARAQCLPHHLLVIGAEGGLIEKPD